MPLNQVHKQTPSTVLYIFVTQQICRYNSLFYQQNKVIGAISAAPVFLVKAGVLNGVPFMCGCPKEGLYEEGFTKEELEHMIEWEEAWAQRDTLKFIRQGCIVTAVAFGFREWAMEIGKMLGIKTYPESFGIKQVE